MLAPVVVLDDVSLNVISSCWQKIYYLLRVSVASSWVGGEGGVAESSMRGYLVQCVVVVAGVAENLGRRPRRRSKGSSRLSLMIPHYWVHTFFSVNYAAA